MDDEGSRNRHNLGSEIMWSKMSNRKLDEVKSIDTNKMVDSLMDISITPNDVNKKVLEKKRKNQQSRNSKMDKHNILTPQPIEGNGIKVSKYESRLGKRNQKRKLD